MRDGSELLGNSNEAGCWHQRDQVVVPKTLESPSPGLPPAWVKCQHLLPPRDYSESACTLQAHHVTEEKVKMRSDAQVLAAAIPLS